MKRLFGWVLALCCNAAMGQVSPGFTSGQILTAAQLNAAFAQAVKTVNGSASNLTVTTGFTATGLITTTDLANQAANTLLGNITGSAASPVAVGLPVGCNTATAALQYTTGSFTCGTVASAGANANITSLTGLTTPLGTSAGGLGVNNSSANGVPVFSSGVASVTTTPALGTPSSVTLTNGVGLPISTGVSGLGTGVATALGNAATGSGGVVLQTSPTITTPTINGITSGVAAGSGVIGQPISNSTGGTTITSGTTVNATSINVPAGDWDCEGLVNFIPTASSVVADIAAGLTTTAATLPAAPDTTYLGVTLATGSSGLTSLNTFRKIVNVSTPTTVYLVAEASSVTGASASVNGYIQCRRVH